MARQTQIARGSHLLTSDIDPRQGLFSESQAPASTMNRIARKLNPTSPVNPLQRQFNSVVELRTGVRLVHALRTLILLILVRLTGTG